VLDPAFTLAVAVSRYEARDQRSQALPQTSRMVHKRGSGNAENDSAAKEKGDNGG
jgi:hypothetical protein